MLRFYTVRILFAALLLLGVRTFSFGQTDPIERLWYNEEGSAKIKIYTAKDGKLYGMIVWLKEPNRDGKPKLDFRNTDKSKRNDPVMGLLILKKFKKDGQNHYEDGTIYDPKNGKTYSCKMTLEGDKLNVRGYIGFSLIGRTTVWTKAD